MKVTEVSVNNTYKASMFEMIFSDRKELLSLYNAVNGASNANPGHNKKLLKSCKTLKDYSEYVSRVRHYAENMDISDAVEQTITECIKEGILSDFLMKNRAEAKKMSIYEYDEVKHMRQTREEGYEDGYNKGCENERNRVNLLNAKLYETGRIEDIIKAANDTAYQQSLFEEFGL